MIEDPLGQALRQSPARPAASAKDAMVAGRMPRSQRPQRAQQIADRALTDGENAGQGKDHQTEEGRPRARTGQGAKEAADWLGQLFVDALQLPPCGPRLARPAATPFAVEPSSAGLRTVGRRRAVPTAPVCGYTGHGSLLEWQCGSLPLLHQEGSFFARRPQNGQKSSLEPIRITPRML